MGTKVKENVLSFPYGRYAIVFQKQYMSFGWFSNYSGQVWTINFLPVASTHGGALVVWREDIAFETFSVNIRVNDRPVASAPWRLTIIYGMFPDDDRLLFFQELHAFCVTHPRSWALIGDFNLICQVANKNN